MPGITGIITKHIKGNEEKCLDKMIEGMRYESFYRYGKYIDRTNGIFVGYVAIENSFADCMPIFNETKDIVMFFTGESYMDAVLINALKTKHDYNQYDASYLIHLYEEQGDMFFVNLNGWYNGLIIDKTKKKSVLFNDRYGIRRIYYHENENALIFASEAKALLLAFPGLRKANAQSMGEYLVYDCVLQNRSFFQDIFVLPQGSAWEFNHGNITKRQYFDLATVENQTPLDEKTFFQDLCDTFVRVLPRYFHESNVSMSLTGGLDTRTIMACLNAKPGTLPCYTFGGKYRDIMDVRLAPRVAEACGQTHVTLKMDDERFLANYAYQVEKAILVSDGLQSVDKADVIYFNKMAREISPIRMTGKYGSQVLKSVFGLRDRSPDEQLIDRDFQNNLARARVTCANLKKGNEFSFRVYSEIPWWWNGFTSAESSQVAVRSPYLDNDLIKLLYRAPSRKVDYGACFQLPLINTYNPKLMNIPTTGTFGGSKSKINCAIRKQFYRTAAIVDKVYIREKLPCSLTHWVGKVDYALSPLHLDKLLAGLWDFRRYRVWYRDQLAPYLYEMLLCERTYNRPYWNKKILRNVINDHTHGRGTYLREIRKILQIELIHRVLMEDM